MTPADVALLTDQYGVTTVVDLRSVEEASLEAPPLLQTHPDVEVHHTPLLHRPPTGRPRVPNDLASLIAPSAEGLRSPYWRYLRERPDSVVAALGLISSASGAALISCAAGKDRTGVVVAFALAEVGVIRQDIVADYLASVPRVPLVLDRLMRSATYGRSLAGRTLESYTPKPHYLTDLLDGLGRRYGGVHGWLLEHGWSDHDHAALAAKLLGACGD